MQPQTQTPLTLAKVGLQSDVKVVIQNTAGKFLGGEADNWFFTDDRAAAAVFYYGADHIPEQLERVRQAHGIVLEAVPLPLNEVYETCDRCKELFMPAMIHFDGKSFFCADCRTGKRRTPATKVSKQAR